MDFSLPIIGLMLGLVIAAITDVRSGRIPNWLTFSLAGFGLTVHTMYDGWGGFFFSLEGLGLGIVCLLFFYIKGGMGAGDVKLLGSIGAIIGPAEVFIAFLITALLGGLYSIIMMTNLGGLRHVRERVLAFYITMKHTRTLPIFGTSAGEPKLRYALVIGLGTIIAQTGIWYGMFW